MPYSTYTNPAYGTLSVSGQTNAQWANPTADVRGLQILGTNPITRYAARWGSTTNFSLDLNFTDDIYHLVSLYVLDWDNQGRTQKIEIINPANSNILDTQNISAFNGGKHLIWKIAGRVTVKITKTGGPDAVASGLFLDRFNYPPEVSLTSPSASEPFMSPATFILKAAATDADGQIQKVEFYSGAAKIGEDTFAPYALTLSNLPGGIYSFTAKATDDLGVITTSAALPINVNAQTPVTSFSYDDAGRLISASNTGGETVVYSYDAVGNHLSTARRLTSVVSIISVNPNSGSVGDAVTIYGTNFSNTAGQNTLTFNGTTAVVTSATATQLTVVVPSGATTGTVSVTTPWGSGTSSVPYTIVPSKAPTITSFTPAVAAPGSSVVVTGTNFETTPSDNFFRVNDTKSLTSVSTATSLTAIVPSYSSGKLSVTTANGKGVSAGDFFIPPPGFGVSNVSVTDRMTIGATKVFSLTNQNSFALILFDGLEGQAVSIDGTGSTFGVATGYIYGIDGSLLMSGSLYSQTKFVDQVILPKTGTYTIAVQNATAGTYSGTIKLLYAPDLPTRQILIDGPSVTSVFAIPGQNRRLTFNGTANQRISIPFINNGLNTATTVQIYKPDGTMLNSTNLSGVFIDTFSLPVAGPYTIFLNPNGASLGTLNVRLYNVVDVTGTISVGGSAVPVATTVPGQNANITFSATSGQRVSLGISGVTNYNGSTAVKILKPDSSVLVTSSAAATLVDPVTIPTTGTYTVTVDPSGAMTGGLTLTLYNVPADATGTITIGGSSASLTTTAPGQNGTLTFSGTTGQKISLKVTSGASTSGNIYIKKPDGSTLASGAINGTSLFINTQTLPSTGTYTILMDPVNLYTGTYTFTLYDAAEVTGPITINGSTLTFTSSTPGKNAAYTFSGTSGQVVTVRMLGGTMGTGGVYLRRANGTTLTQTGGNLSNPFNLTQQTLPATETYTIYIDPDGENIGSVSVKITSP